MQTHLAFIALRSRLALAASKIRELANGRNANFRKACKGERALGASILIAEAYHDQKSVIDGLILALDKITSGKSTIFRSYSWNFSIGNF